MERDDAAAEGAAADEAAAAAAEIVENAENVAINSARSALWLDRLFYQFHMGGNGDGYGDELEVGMAPMAPPLLQVEAEVEAEEDPEEEAEEMDTCPPTPTANVQKVIWGIDEMGFLRPLDPQPTAEGGESAALNEMFSGLQVGESSMGAEEGSSQINWEASKLDEPQPSTSTAAALEASSLCRPWQDGNKKPGSGPGPGPGPGSGSHQIYMMTMETSINSQIIFGMPSGHKHGFTLQQFLRRVVAPGNLDEIESLAKPYGYALWVTPNWVDEKGRNEERVYDTSGAELLASAEAGEENGKDMAAMSPCHRRRRRRQNRNQRLSLSRGKVAYILLKYFEYGKIWALEGKLIPEYERLVMFFNKLFNLKKD